MRKSNVIFQISTKALMIIMKNVFYIVQGGAVNLSNQEGNFKSNISNQKF